MPTSKLGILVEAKTRAANQKLKETSDVIDDIGVSGKLAGAAMGAFSVAAITAAGAVALDLARTAAESQRLEVAFNNLAMQAGTSGDVMLSALKRASRGTISEYDLMLAANRAMLLGVSANTEELTTLMEVARVRGAAMGLSMTQAFNDIVTGVGRASPLILDNLGITIDAEGAYERFAESIGTTADQLNEAGKKQAILNDVLDTSQEMIDGAAGSALTAAEKFEKMDAAAADLKVSVGLLIAEPLADWAITATGAVDKLADALANMQSRGSFGDMEAQMFTNPGRVMGGDVFDYWRRLSNLGGGDQREVERIARLKESKTVLDGVKKTTGDILSDEEKIALWTKEGSENTGKMASAARAVNTQWERLKSTVSGVLSGAIGPVAGIDANDLLPRQDAINEDARRLADVAVNGYASPWADYLVRKFPLMFEEAFQGGDMKTVAAKALRDFQDGLVPALLDKDTAKKRIERMIIGQQNLSALAGEIAAELAAELGVAAPANLESLVGMGLGLSDTSGEGQSAGQAFGDGAVGAVQNTNAGTRMIQAVNAQLSLEGNISLIYKSGKTYGDSWANGFMETAINLPSQVIQMLASLVAPYVQNQQEAQASRTGAQ